MSDIFKPVDWSVQQLVDSISSGTLRLPDLQRPFVWHATKVRDLLDSMYRGYPVGELMFWNQPGDSDTSVIGTDAKDHSASHLIVDGQQRITSLYVTFTGKNVIDDDYRDKSVRISFNPALQRFEVAQPAFDRSAEWIADVAQVFGNPLTAFQAFKTRLEESRGAPLTDSEQATAFEAINRLHNLKSRTFKVVELQPHVDKAVVADVFVRINSEGMNLTAADFILTWLSVFWPEGRDDIESFARHSRLTAERATEIAKADPSSAVTTPVKWTPKNHYIAPTPGQLTRVAVAVGQGRGRLQDAYNALRALDRKTGQTDPERQALELDRLKSAVPLVLKRMNWDEYLRVLAKAGYRSQKMVTSKTTILYTYVIWLMGRERFDVNVSVLRDLMARWFFMAQTTGRYTSSPETMIQRDLDRFDGVTDAEGFQKVIESVISTVLTNDFWTIRLADDFNSSSTSASPAYQAYLASLNILDADLFMLHGKVRDWTDPTATAVRDVEGHHLFPKAYLRDVLGYTDMKKINQVANFAPTDWATNNDISDRPPMEYWPDLVAARSMSGDALAKQQKWHALPQDWSTMGYEDFLVARRRLMAAVVRDGYLRLEDPSYQPSLPSPTGDGADTVSIPVTLLDLINGGVLNANDLIESTDAERPVIGEITEDGEIIIDDKTYDTPARAAAAMGNEAVDPWDFWALATDNGSITLSDLKRQLTAG